MDALSKVIRELPDTDKNRYEIAYERGRAQARSSLLFGGLAVGALAGAAATFFLDPQRGKARRHEIGRQLTGRRNDLARALEGRSKDARNRLQGVAAETGVAKPDTPDDAAAREGTMQGATEYRVPETVAGA